MWIAITILASMTAIVLVLLFNLIRGIGLEYERRISSIDHKLNNPIDNGNSLYSILKNHEEHIAIARDPFLFKVNERKGPWVIVSRELNLGSKSEPRGKVYTVWSGTAHIRYTESELMTLFGREN